MSKRLCIIISSLVISLSSMAQVITSPMDSADCKPFSHMQVGVTAGTTGLGVEVGASISKNVRVRAGFSIMPNITLDKGYSMTTETSGEGTELDDDYKINHLCECLSDIVGQPVDGTIEMSHQLSFHNFHVLVDWYPFKKKHWHFTGGFYVGPKSIGKAFNANTECNTLVGVNIYNMMYDNVINLEDDEYPVFKLGSHYYELDPRSGAYMKDAFRIYGRVAVKMGEFPDGTPHYIYPDENGRMQADAETIAFKPYVGFGWSTDFGYDKRWTVSFDAGALYWGKPHVYCNDGVDLVNDVKNIGGDVGKYIDLIKHLPVYPNLTVRLAYRIF